MGFPQIDLSLIDKNLTENDLTDNFKKISAMPAGSAKYELSISTAKRPDAPTVLIKKIINIVSHEINNINIDKKNKYLKYLKELNKIYIFKLLAKKSLTENDLKIIFTKKVLTISKECGKYECSIIIAKHPNVSPKLIEEMMITIFHKVDDINKRDKCLNKRNKCLNKLIEIYFDLLVRKAKTENDLENILKEVSTIILKECGKHNPIIKKNTIKKIYVEVTTRRLFKKLRDVTLTEDKLKEITEIALTSGIDKKYKNYILEGVAKHPNSKMYLAEQIRECISNDKTIHEDIKMRSLRRIDKAISKKKEMGDNLQQLKQSGQNIQNAFEALSAPRTMGK